MFKNIRMKDLQKNFYLLFSLVGGFIVRLIATSGHNLMFGYDEVTDLILTKRIALNQDLIAIGKAIYGNPDLRHGVLSYYLMAPAVIISQDPTFIAIWNGLFSLATAVILYFIAKSLFKNTNTGIVAAALFAFSYPVIGFSNWVSHPTFAPLFVSLFYLGLIKISEGSKWGYILTAISLGFAIQSDLLFIYLIPILFIFLLLFRPKFPGLKILLISALSFLTVMSSFIYSEINFNFSTTRTVLNFSGSLDASKVPIAERAVAFLNNYFAVFAANLIPQAPNLGILLAVLIVLVIIYYRKYFLIFFLFSPAIMLIVGFHAKSWSLLGALPAISLAIAFVISKIRLKPLMIIAVVLIVFLNTKATLTAKAESKFFISIPKSSVLSSQLAVIDYTYESSGGRPFSIDAVNYPLYVNSYWSYHYPWYGAKKYGYMPTWSGSDQLYPYSTLSKSTGDEEYVYLMIDNTPDIPSWAKEDGKKYWDERSGVMEEKEIEGFIVQKRKIYR